MPKQNPKTTKPEIKAPSTIKSEPRLWYLFDAKDEVLGRLSTKIATILRGKDKPSFAPNADLGDYVVVLNAKKVKLTGNKEAQKMYYKHTGYIGNLKSKTIVELREENPEMIIKHAVNGMLPKNKLQDVFMSRLKIYAGNTHPHQNVKFTNQE